MLNIPLPQLKRDLEEMLLDIQHLATALKQLRDLLPEQSEKRVTVLTMLGRLNDANKKALRGTLDNTSLQTEYNAIRADLSDFIQGLEEADFDANAKDAASAKAAAAKQGNVLYRIPDAMSLHVETECVVRIALDEDAIVEEITLDNQVVLKSLSRVSDLMQVELADPAREAVFAIRSTSPAQQLITEEGYTQWFFYVEPQRVGTHPLEVKVSVLEMALNQIHRKELVFRETIQIFTEGAAAEGDNREEVTRAASGFKSAGQAFAFEGPPSEAGNAGANAQKGIETPTMPAPAAPVPSATSPSRNSGLRTLALFLAFIILGSTATWAFTPAETRDWWVASLIQDDTKAYATYIEKHPESPYVEKAYFYKAESSQQLADLRDYQDKFPDGKFQSKVLARITTLETEAFENVRMRPNRDNIRQFAADFPETEKLTDVKAAAEARADNRAELMAAVEDAYVASARKKPTESKITNYLRDFPQHTRLGDVTEAAAAKPEVMAKVQEKLEDAYLKKMEPNPTSTQAEEFLKTFPEPVKQEKFEEILDKKPAVKKKAVKMMQEMKEVKALGRPSGLEMVLVEGGTFQMGNSEGPPSDCVHPVTIRSFHIGKYETTQADWFEIMGTKPSYLSRCDECPVEQVSWKDVQIFLIRLNKKYPGRKYRLPTEEEWEFAARGGTKSRGYTYSGSNDLNKVAWNISNANKKPQAVGLLAPNEIGIYDMSGNVYEWCQDKYGPYPGCNGEISNHRVLRGGSYVNDPTGCCLLCRLMNNPEGRSSIVGLRLAHD